MASSDVDRGEVDQPIIVCGASTKPVMAGSVRRPYACSTSASTDPSSSAAGKLDIFTFRTASADRLTVQQPYAAEWSSEELG